MKLIKKGSHFKAGDTVVLKDSWKVHGHLVEELGDRRHVVSRVTPTKNLPYCDQFIRVNGHEYYNTIFQKV